MDRGGGISPHTDSGICPKEPAAGGSGDEEAFEIWRVGRDSAAGIPDTPSEHGRTELQGRSRRTGGAHRRQADLINQPPNAR